MSGRVSVKSGSKSLSWKKQLARGRSMPWGRTLSAGRPSLRSISSAGGSVLPGLIAVSRGLVPETKYCGARVVDANFNNTISSADCYPLCPSITQGTGDYQRLGTRIRGKYIIVRGTVTLNDAMNTGTGGFGSQSYGPIIVRLLMLSCKAATNNNQIGGLSNQVNMGCLIDDRIGTGATRQFTGNNYDVYAPLNKDLFKVWFDRKVKLVPQLADTASTASFLGQRTHSFWCKIPAPANMTFDDTSSGNEPTNYAPFLCAGWAYMNDKTPGTVDQVPVHIEAISTLYFSDA